MAKRLVTERERHVGQPVNELAASRPGQLVPLLTLEEVAGFLRLNPRTVRRLTAAGKLPSVRVCGRLRFEADAVAKFVEARKG